MITVMTVLSSYIDANLFPDNSLDEGIESNTEDNKANTAESSSESESESSSSDGRDSDNDSVDEERQASDEERGSNPKKKDKIKQESENKKNKKGKGRKHKDAKKKGKEEIEKEEDEEEENDDRTIEPVPQKKRGRRKSVVYVPESFTGSFENIQKLSSDDAKKAIAKANTEKSKRIEIELARRIRLEKDFFNMGGRQYNLILLDPPWDYGPGWTVGAAAEKYTTIRTKILEQFPVPQITAPVCACLMWATGKKMGDAISIMQHWGFEYKTVSEIR